MFIKVYGIHVHPILGLNLKKMYIFNDNDSLLSENQIRSRK